MQRTILTTPILSPAFTLISRVCLKAAGWRVEGHLSVHARKSVFIAAPCASNWDLPMTLMVARCAGAAPWLDGQEAL